MIEISLLVKIGADLSSFEREMKKATKDITYIGKKFETTGKKLTTGLTLPIVGLGAAAVKIGSDFQSSMSKVAAITGATGDDFDKLREQAKKLGATTTFSASQSAEAMTYLGMAGYDTNQIIAAMPGLLDLAAASGADLATTADIVSDAMTAFGMSADQTGKFADLLASASTNANTNVQMLGESFKYVAPVAGALGYSAEDTTFALGLMANAGIKGSQAGTSLRGALTRMISPTEKAAELMEELGIQMTDSSGEMLPLNEVLHDLRDSFADLTEEQQAQYASAIFGKEAMSGMLAIINASSEDIIKLTEATNDYDGAAKDMADTMNDNLLGRLKQLWSMVEGVAIEIADVLIPMIEKVIEKFATWVEWFANLDDEQKELLVKVAMLVAALGPLLLIISKVIGAITFLKGAAAALGIATGVLVAKILIVMAILAALIAVGVLVYKNWDTIKEYALKLWASLQNTFVGIGETIAGVWNGVKESTNKAWQGMTNGIKGFINGIINALNKMIGAMNKLKFDIPSWVPVLGGNKFGFNIPKIPQLATGTNYVPQDMLAVIHKGEQVVPKKYNPNAGGMGRPVNIFVDLDGRTIVKAIRQPLANEIRVATGWRA